ncbi:DNA/RNA non-specific endonuclease [Lactobacillus xujianguonis]|uniref:DNA/RNA non-specific endonuclease n=1 Tax=Lactobacillus xujianguonis TaxID=2495899 RepID=A0A437ST81_9LACO|nr:DNA/RNA non-specific endonuclease [Lactobacillus xujianguonis]RVU70151.1 DNA/RNA non-specific endonuclease [Lactobacillus xujianguonis]RVU73369.1 DNA/RNA non-specific endonuclease [Lactobacillus xujianguonis]
MAYRRKRRRKENTFLSIVVLVIALAWGIYTKGGQNFNGNNFAKNTSTDSSLNKMGTAQKVYGGLTRADYQKLAALNFKSGDKAYLVLNHDRSTLIKSAWKVNRVIYANLDQLNRTSHSNTAFLERRNVANDSLRVRQFVEPTAWHYNRRNRTQIYNRGHLIAYSVSAGINQSGDYNPRDQSGDQNNPKNLFTQSAFSNQKIQTIFESKIRQALRQNKRVIYQATPVFHGDELMARGINLQAVATDGSLDFNVYLFNVQPGYIFNYQNGRAKVDRQMRVNE